MKAILFLQKLQPNRLLERHHRRHANWLHLGEAITPRAVVITEDEMRYHHRLEAQSQVERFAN